MLRGRNVREYAGVAWHNLSEQQSVPCHEQTCGNKFDPNLVGTKKIVCWSIQGQGFARHMFKACNVQHPKMHACKVDL